MRKSSSRARTLIVLIGVLTTGTQIPLEIDWYYGLRLRVYLGNDVSRQLFVGATNEPNEMALVNRMLAPGMVFIDAGANEGMYTLLASRRAGNEGRVYAFEPSAREFERLQANVALNRLENVRCVQAALAESKGEAELKVADEVHAGHNTLGSLVHQGVQELRRETVPLTTVDAFAEEEKLSRVDMIKIDTEGAELRVLQGAARVLRDFRPVLLFEASEASLANQGASREALLDFLGSQGYTVYSFSEKTGNPEPHSGGMFSENMIAAPVERPIPHDLYGPLEPDPLPNEAAAAAVRLPRARQTINGFSPGSAYWNQRQAIAQSAERIRALSAAVGRTTDLMPFQFAQLFAAAREFSPDLILELGRGKGNSTCAYCEAANQLGKCRVISICNSSDWEEQTQPKLRQFLPDEWFAPLQIHRGDILTHDYRTAIGDARRVLLFWDAHGFEIAECVLGVILPLLAGRDHIVIMHDLSDARYSAPGPLAYNGRRLWKGENAGDSRVRLDYIDSAVAQSISITDFAARNRIGVDSADHSNDLEINQQSGRVEAMRNLLGPELFALQAHWFWFSLNERAGPFTFPVFEPPSGIEQMMHAVPRTIAQHVPRTVLDKIGSTLWSPLRGSSKKP